MRSTRGRKRDAAPDSAPGWSTRLHHAGTGFMLTLASIVIAAAAWQLQSVGLPVMLGRALAVGSLLVPWIVAWRMLRRGRWRRRKAALGSYVLGAVVPWLCALPILVPGLLDAWHARTFEAAAWRSAGEDVEGAGSHVRFDMIRDLRDSEVLIGMTRHEVEALLGPALSEGRWNRTEGPLVYDVGSSRAAFGPDHTLLRIEFEGGRVVRTRLTMS